MPYIKKIELKGFKSFGPKKVTVVVEDGFTVLTGPNGSGKTNIVDAILFVLGELSARRLRASNLASLIFHGSPDAGIDKAKSAKVVLQFDNSDGRIPVETNTVTISREVFKNGQCVYRLNGRRISRANIQNMLSMAGIAPTSHNIILQGTITRMTDISSNDRRKIIEEMIGIAQYDIEKAEAEEKLRVAEISIRTAMGRVDEVQKRVDDLERERNVLLQYNFVQHEIKRFEAFKLSHEIKAVEEKLSEKTASLQEAKGNVEKLRNVRDEIRGHRRSIESEWRRLSSEMVERGGSRVLEVQIKIGDLKSRLTELATKVGAGKTTFEGLKKVRENNVQQLDSMKEEITGNRTKSKQLKRKRDRLLEEIKGFQDQHDSFAGEASYLWESIGANTTEIRKVQQQLDVLSQEIADVKNDIARRQISKRVLTRRLNDLKRRRERYKITLEDLTKSFTDLSQVQEEQKTQMKNFEGLIQRRQIQKEAVVREIDEAGRIAGTAREAVIEFATQREIAEAVAGEERALRNIEELSELGVILGVFGRLKNLVKLEKKYKKALEAAAAGWLDALVVQDLEAAFTCIETLKRLKLGRIKVIPIRGLTKKNNGQPVKEASTQLATAYVTNEKRHEPAVEFVFGDTLIANNDKKALEFSLKGFRSVTSNGDVYEPGGGFESGFYRSPVDLSTIIPSENAIKNLDEAVNALQKHLTKRVKDISFFDDDIRETGNEITHLAEAVATLDNEIDRLSKSKKNTLRNIRRLGFHIRGVETKLEREKTEIGVHRAESRRIRKEMQKLRNKLVNLRNKTDPKHIQEIEIQRDRLADKIITLRQNLGSVETGLSTIISKYDNVLKLGYKNISVQLRKVEKQLSVVEKEVEDALREREKLKDELLKLEESREELSKIVLGAREEAKRFANQIDDIDKELKTLDIEYEHADRLQNQLQLSTQTLRLQIEGSKRQLREFGYETLLPVSPKQLEEAETSLKMMRFELERLGAVNQLALSHYSEQISRYKELSLRMNELESEKQAIVDFMNEIERKKRTVFMEAFHKINTNLEKYFAKITGEGRAELKLENFEEPFTGGIDMIVEFPGKPPILVTGASGGERSVSAVAFLLAIQEFTPTAFYILDEVDAHLDAFHVSKLGELLVQEGAKSQFIVVTLKPEMLKKAQRVYGVYERNGSSNMISTTFMELKA